MYPTANKLAEPVKEIPSRLIGIDMALGELAKTICDLEISLGVVLTPRLRESSSTQVPPPPTSTMLNERLVDIENRLSSSIQEIKSIKERLML